VPASTPRCVSARASRKLGEPFECCMHESRGCTSTNRCDRLRTRRGSVRSPYPGESCESGPSLAVRSRSLARSEPESLVQSAAATCSAAASLPPVGCYAVYSRDHMNPLALLVPLALIVLALRMLSGNLDHARIRHYVGDRGGRVVGIRWTPLGAGWWGESKDRIYELEYEDSRGQRRTASVKTSMFGGVYMTEDRPSVSFGPMKICRRSTRESGPHGKCSSRGQRTHRTPVERQRAGSWGAHGLPSSGESTSRTSNSCSARKKPTASSRDRAPQCFGRPTIKAA